MNAALLEKLVEVVLYEGYILYPYRPSARKNRQRFTFGRVYPETYSRTQDGREPCLIQTQCLIRSSAADAGFDISVRFLQPMSREIGLLESPLNEWPATSRMEIKTVSELDVEGELHQSWQESLERNISVPCLPIRPLVQDVAFAFPASRSLEPIRDSQSRVVAVITRRREAINGVVEVALDRVEGALFRVTVRVTNHTPLPDLDSMNDDQILMHIFASTHTILTARNGEFLSLTDPPSSYREAAGQCKNTGTWPVLVGDEEKGERDSMLSSPIILPDYPKIAPESAGSYFDGTEIDEMLMLRIQTMTDAEKSEMRQVDEQARRLLERTESLSSDQMRKLHGTFREAPSPIPNVFNDNGRLREVNIGGIQLQAGDRVRIRPKARADVMDIALAGRMAVIEAVEQDAEGGIHFALVLPDDPGMDLGMLRQPGHRFFYGLDEVEPMKEKEGV